MSIRFQLLRHATVLLGVGSETFLVDPMLGAPGELPHVGLTRGSAKNPLVPLPSSPPVWSDPDVNVLVTHLHFDHFDAAADRLLNSSVQIFAAPDATKPLRARGFERVCPVTDRRSSSGGTEIIRHETRHARGVLGRVLGSNSTYLLVSGSDRILITGDALFDDVSDIARREEPNVLIVNAGSAMFWGRQRATMNSTEVRRLATEFAHAVIVTVHLEALNHCIETRDRTREMVAGLPHVLVPEDGEVVVIGSPS